MDVGTLLAARSADSAHSTISNLANGSLVLHAIDTRDACALDYVVLPQLDALACLSVLGLALDQEQDRGRDLVAEALPRGVGQSHAGV